MTQTENHWATARSHGADGSGNEFGQRWWSLDPSSGRGVRPCIRQFRGGSEREDPALRLMLHSPWYHLNMSASGYRLLQTFEESLQSSVCNGNFDGSAQQNESSGQLDDMRRAVASTR